MRPRPGSSSRLSAPASFTRLAGGGGPAGSWAAAPSAARTAAPSSAARRARMARHFTWEARLRARRVPLRWRLSLPPANATAPAHPRWLSGLATGAAVAFGVGLIFTLHQRDAARHEVEELHGQTDALQSRLRAIDQDREALQRRLAWEASLRDLVAHPEARTTALANPGAGARGRVVWNPATREAVLVASGLDPAPPGKAHAGRVNACGAASPAGLFQVEPDGRAAFRLPALEQMTRVRSLSVTLEPASGTPAPTGPVVLG